MDGKKTVLAECESSMDFPEIQPTLTAQSVLWRVFSVDQSPTAFCLHSYRQTMTRNTKVSIKLYYFLKAWVFSMNETELIVNTIIIMLLSFCNFIYNIIILFNSLFCYFNYFYVCLMASKLNHWSLKSKHENHIFLIDNGSSLEILY